MSAASIRQWLGHSTGRWDGDTLVVETTNFTDKILYRGAAENLQLVERIKRVGPDELEYRVTITDPTTFTRPWTVAIPYVNTGEDDVRIRVPRGQLRHGRDPQRRARRRTESCGGQDVR